MIGSVIGRSSLSAQPPFPPPNVLPYQKSFKSLKSHPSAFSVATSKTSLFLDTDSGLFLKLEDTLNGKDRSDQGVIPFGEQVGDKRELDQERRPAASPDLATAEDAQAFEGTQSDQGQVDGRTPADPETASENADHHPVRHFDALGQSLANQETLLNRRPLR